MSLLILATGGVENSDDRHPDAVTLFHCRFDQAWDANHDKWPDRWKRKRGPDFPHYLNVEIEPAPTARSGHCLKIQLDGGAASVFSPPIPIDSIFSYVLEGCLKTNGLVHDRAFFTITFYDGQGTARATVTSDKFCDVADWHTVRIGPVSPQHDDVETAVIGLHLHPGQRRDLRGAAWFDDIWFARLPRMVLDLNSALNLHDDPGQVQLTCQVWGAAQRDPEISFELLDAEGQRIEEARYRLDGERIVGRSSSASNSDRLDQAARAAYAGRIVWKVPTADYGYYRVRVTMWSAARVVQQRLVSLAVLRPIRHSDRGEFGWTLPGGDNSVSLDALPQLLSRTGIHWLKFPLWYGSGDRARGDRIMKFAQRLEPSKIRLVGLLDTPPPDVLSTLHDGPQLSAASIFSADPSVWHASLDPIMTRLSLRIRWWQLGGDHDRSFVGYPDLADKVQDIRERLFRFGQKAHLGIGWDWLSESPSDSTSPWEFVTFSANPPLTGTELATYLAGVDRQWTARWVLVEPLALNQYDLATRAQDLVIQMMSAKMEKADAIFLPDPFDAQHGLLNNDGTPGPLLLPWRTTALLLGGTTYLGSIRMPGGSHNHIFSRAGEAVMVVWREKPTREVIFLGHDVRQIDIWGRTTQPEQDGHRQVIKVGPLPKFITGIDASVARWREALSLTRTQLPSVFGQPHANGVRINNFFPQGVGGEVRIVAPKGLRSVPELMRIKAARGEQTTMPFEITLPLGASSGPQDIRFDFDISAGRQFRFSVYRQIQIGLGHVVIQTSTRLDEEGTLVVEQQTKNNSDNKISFRFLLYAPNRRSQRSHVMELDRGQDLKTYRYADGRALLGRTLWLRAEEIDGLRIFNHRFVAER